MLEYDRIDNSEGLDIKKQMHQKSAKFVIICTFGFKYEPHLCNSFQGLMQKAVSFLILLLFILKEKLTEFIFGI